MLKDRWSACMSENTKNPAEARPFDRVRAARPNASEERNGLSRTTKMEKMQLLSRRWKCERMTGNGRNLTSWWQEGTFLRM